jgi:hypothetical protein
MPFCTKCGLAGRVGDAFCARCGERLTIQKAVTGAGSTSTPSSDTGSHSDTSRAKGLQVICVPVATVVGILLYQAAAPVLWGSPDVIYPNWPRIIGAAIVGAGSAGIGAAVGETDSERANNRAPI